MSNEKRRQTRVTAEMAAKSAAEDPKMVAAKDLFDKKKNTILGTLQALETLYFANLPKNEQVERTGAIVASSGEEGQKKRDELKAIVDRQAAREGVKEYVDQLLILVGDQKKASFIEAMTGEDKPGAKSFKTILQEKEAEIRKQVQLIDQKIVALNNAANEKPADFHKVSQYKLEIGVVWENLVKMEDALQKDLQERIERKEIPLQPIEEDGLKNLINIMHQGLSRLERGIQESQSSADRVTNDSLMQDLREKLESLNSDLELRLLGANIDLNEADNKISEIISLLGALDEDQEKQVKGEIDQLNAKIERVGEIPFIELDALLDQTASMGTEMDAEPSEKKLDELLKKEFGGLNAEASQAGETPSIEEILGEDKSTEADVTDLNASVKEEETKRQPNPSRLQKQVSEQEAAVTLTEDIEDVAGLLRRQEEIKNAQEIFGAATPGELSPQANVTDNQTAPIASILGEQGRSPESPPSLGDKGNEEMPIQVDDQKQAQEAKGSQPATPLDRRAEFREEIGGGGLSTPVWTDS